MLPAGRAGLVVAGAGVLVGAVVVAGAVVVIGTGVAAGAAVVDGAGVVAGAAVVAAGVGAIVVVGAEVAAGFTEVAVIVVEGLEHPVMTRTMTNRIEKSITNVFILFSSLLFEYW
jgi:hypothetical protein